MCFGSNAEICSSDNLYRIIGVFEDQVKLIKNTSLVNYPWSGSSSNQSNRWNISTLNTEILNGTYLNELGTTWSDMIETTSWKVGGTAYSTTSTVKQYYTTELGSSSSSTKYSEKIVLMYINEYGYATSPTYWTTELYNYEPSISSNWLHLGSYEWTISRSSNYTGNAVYVSDTGKVSYSDVNNNYATRPTFYLKSNVILTDGTGTSTDPYRLSVQ